MYWYKSYVNRFEDPRVKSIRKHKNGWMILGLYELLYASAAHAEANGKLYYTKGTPYTPELIAEVWDIPTDEVKAALDVLRELKYIKTDKSGCMAIADWKKEQAPMSEAKKPTTPEEEERLEKRREQYRQYRLRKREQKLAAASQQSLPTVAPCQSPQTRHSSATGTATGTATDTPKPLHSPAAVGGQAKAVENTAFNGQEEVFSQQARRKSATDAPQTRHSSATEKNREYKDKKNIDIYINSESESENAARDARRERECTELIKFFNSNTTFPSIDIPSDKQKSAILTALNMFGSETVKQCLLRAEKSDYLTGRKEGRAHKAELCWLLTPKNTEAILNGKYDDFQKRNPPKPPEVSYSSGCDYADLLESML